jgi:hypothetical protein
MCFPIQTLPEPLLSLGWEMVKCPADFFMALSSLSLSIPLLLGYSLPPPNFNYGPGLPQSTNYSCYPTLYDMIIMAGTYRMYFYCTGWSESRCHRLWARCRVSSHRRVLLHWILITTLQGWYRHRSLDSRTEKEKWSQRKEWLRRAIHSQCLECHFLSMHS